MEVLPFTKQKLEMFRDNGTITQKEFEEALSGKLSKYGLILSPDVEYLPIPPQKRMTYNQIIRAIKK